MVLFLRTRIMLRVAVSGPFRKSLEQQAREKKEGIRETKANQSSSTELSRQKGLKLDHQATTMSEELSVIEKIESLTVSTEEGNASGGSEDEAAKSKNDLTDNMDEGPQLVELQQGSQQEQEDADCAHSDGELQNDGAQYEYYSEREKEYADDDYSDGQRYQHYGAGVESPYEHEGNNGDITQDSIYGYEEHVPRRRRSSIVGHIMAWAGAVNQEYYDSQLNVNNRNPTPARPRDENRRASMDNAASSSTPKYVPPVSRRTSHGQASYPHRCHSSDEIGESDNDPPNDGASRRRMSHIRRPYDDPEPERRNSLHAMVERAMAFVSLKPDLESDDLCPFGTRRDSLF